MLDQLRLRNFRCFGLLDCSLEGEVTLFAGNNAHGKTTILESICMLLRLQSPRAGTLSEVVRLGEAGFVIEGGFSGRHLMYSLSGTRRQMKVDGNISKNRADYLAQTGLVVWMGNDDLSLVRGSGEVRRRYMDFAASQIYPGYRNAFRAYKRALRARNFLLKRDRRPPWELIAAYTKLLVDHGTVIGEARANLVAALSPSACHAQSTISGRDEPLGLEYVKSGGEDLAAAYEQSADEDGRRRQTNVGPHRDDILLEIKGLPAGQFASEGQQRTIALALKLAQAEVLRVAKDSDPVLLIDDIFGELDQARRNALLSYLPESSQKLITTTHLDWADEEFLNTAQRYVVDGNGIC
jgi:DNA replication and repair protein RecF